MSAGFKGFDNVADFHGWPRFNLAVSNKIMEAKLEQRAS